MRMRRRILQSVLVLTIGILGLALAAPAYAVTKTWVGEGSDWWNIGSNWNPTGQPQDGDGVYLIQSDAANRTVWYFNPLSTTPVLYFLDIDATGTGTITFWQGQDNFSAETEYIGVSGTGSLTQSNGNNTINSYLYLGRHLNSNGTYDLSGTGSSLSAVDEYIGEDGGTGSFTQSGGSNTSKLLFLGKNSTGNGSYDLSGTGNLSAVDEYIGDGGTGSFTQNGGNNNAISGLFLGSIASGHTGNGSYDLSGTGNLSAGYEYIGDSGTSIFTQSGGNNTIRNDLYLGFFTTGNGTYSISAGNLEVKNFSVGVDGNGTLKITDPAANITVSNLLNFGPDSTLTAVPGATIHMTGSTFVNKSTDPAALAGLSNLKLVFEGGSADTDPVEVAGKDLGAVMAGFDNNFALDALTLGGTDIGNIKLSDLFDNQPGWTGSEALYVYNLNIGAGSDLNLNGLNLYYLNGSIDPGATIDYNGGQLTPIPEPATFLLLGTGLLGLIGYARRKISRA